MARPLMHLLLVLVIVHLQTSCAERESNIKSVIIDKNLIAIGNIQPDSTYEGCIQFFDVREERVVETATYQKGKLNGERKVFHRNGNVKARMFYENGKVTGMISLFDSTGALAEKQTLYYDLRVGSNIKYFNNQIAHYAFYSLENEELFSIAYDSLMNTNLSELNGNSLFFWHVNHIFTDGRKRAELFLYLPNPPKLNFQYSLSVVDKQYRIIKNVHECAMNAPWETIYLDSVPLQAGESLAMVLEIDSELDSDERILTSVKGLEEYQQ